MRHRRKGSRLNRKSNQLKALLRNLVTSLVLNGQMVTTISKAKALIPVFDRLVVTIKKKDEMNGIRAAQKVLFGQAAQKKLVQEVVPAISRTSGFCSLLKVGSRAGDNAQVVRIQILTDDVTPQKENAVTSTKETIEVAEEKAPKKAPAKKSTPKTAAKKTTKKVEKKEEAIPEQK